MRSKPTSINRQTFKFFTTRALLSVFSAVADNSLAMAVTENIGSKPGLYVFVVLLCSAGTFSASPGQVLLFENCR